MFRASRIRDLPTVVYYYLLLSIAAYCCLLPAPAFARNEINLGLSSVCGTVDSQSAYLGVSVEGRGFTMNAGFNYAETADLCSEDRGHIRFGYDYKASDNWYLWAFEETGYNHIRDIDFESRTGAGPKLSFIHTKELDLSLSIGGLYHTTNYGDGAQDSLFRASVRPKFRGEWERWELRAVAFYQPALENCHDYILSGLSSLRYAITDRVGLKLSVEDEFRSISIGENNNLATSLSLSWGF